MNKLLEVMDAVIGYGGAPVVRQVSFALEPGRIGCLLGPSGCGKSTLGPGTIVGQLSLLTRAPATTSLVAETDVVLLRLPSARVAELASEFPHVLAHLSELAATASDVITDELGL